VGGGSYCDWHPASDKARSHKVAEGHPGDARVAGVCQIGSQTMRIVPTNNDIQFEVAPPS